MTRVGALTPGKWASATRNPEPVRRPPAQRCALPLSAAFKQRKSAGCWRTALPSGRSSGVDLGSAMTRVVTARDEPPGSGGGGGRRRAALQSLRVEPCRIPGCTRSRPADSWKCFARSIPLVALTTLCCHGSLGMCLPRASFPYLNGSSLRMKTNIGRIRSSSAGAWTVLGKEDRLHKYLVDE